MGEMTLAGRYEIIEKIGDGGMAVVYKGRDRLLKRFVAIKVLRPEYTKDPAFVESFRKESEAAAGLSHPSIVNVYDVGKEGSVYYIVMELIDGKTLSDYIKDEGPLDYKRAIGVAKQIASALSLAHKNNIIHRDVKPHNILIMNDGSAKITDFGIAKAVSDATIVEKGGDAIMGSVHYFSPEQARGGYVDEKSDIYSLGIVIYEMLTGRVPFDAENPVTVAVMHMNDKPTPPSQVVSGIPPGLEQIVMKAVEKYQINRFKTADDIYEALDNVNFITGIIENQEVADKVREKPSASGEGEDPKKKGAGARPGKGEMEDNKKKKKNFMKVRILAIALALACALPVSYFIFSGIQELRAPKEVSVPNLVGMTEDEAADALGGLGLEVEVVDLITSAEIDEGRIVSQERPEGSMVKEGYKVRVNISRGAPAVESETAEVPATVPYLIGRDIDEALRIIESYGYREGDISWQNDKLPVNRVISQSPDSGREADPGARINLVVSLGEPEQENVAMPNLLGLTMEAAARQLSSNGLTMGAVTNEPSSNYVAGLVTGQQYAPETEVSRGSAVDVKVSSGAAVVTRGPRTVAIDIDFKDAPNEVFNLSVWLVDSEGRRSIALNEAVRYKSSGGDSVAVTGEGTGTVYVLFSGVQVMSFTVDFSTGAVSAI